MSISGASQWRLGVPLPPGQTLVYIYIYITIHLSLYLSLSLYIYIHTHTYSHMISAFLQDEDPDKALCPATPSCTRRSRGRGVLWESVKQQQKRLASP